MAAIMPEPRELSSPALATPPRVFCKGCGYALVGLQSNKCPECGRGFDLGNRRTFARRPPRSWVWRWGRRVLAGVLLLLLTAGTGVGWLWWGWRAEQPTIVRLREPNARFKLKAIGPERLRSVLGERLAYLTQRADSAEIVRLRVAETEQLDLHSLAHIQRLRLVVCEMSNTSLSRLGGLEKLKELHLLGLRTDKPDLTFLEKLPLLSTLALWGTWVPKAGLEHVGRLVQLKVLSLRQTGITNADLQHLKGLSSLEELDLWNNPINGDGLEYLRGLKSLRQLWIDRRQEDSLGVAKLKEAIPGLKVN
jgi:hypothetical protein